MAIDADQPVAPAVCIWVLLTPVMVVSFVLGLDRLDPGIEPPPALSTVNPSTAPWWELTVLPEIGELTALKIVAYREQATPRGPGIVPRRVFRIPADLDNVHGIGIKTVQSIAPHLRFDKP